VTYLWVLVLTLVGPVLKSFEPRVHYVSQWAKALLAGAATALVFIPWDIYFTHRKIWGFNAEHVLGVRFCGLPLEEWLFFFIMPFACIFISESLKVHQWRVRALESRWFAGIAAALLAGVGLANWEKTYTLWAFVAAAAVTLRLVWLDGPRRAQVLTAYAVCLIPFYIANGVLTGALTTEPVVWYNNAQNLGFRFWTIPVEDHFYMMAHIIPSFLIFDRLKAVG
jgi:lycopene cyclase domain-containing protein